MIGFFQKKMESEDIKQFFLEWCKKSKYFKTFTKISEIILL